MRVAEPSVPHPGPRPEAFVFPYAAARRALSAIDELLADLSSLELAHDDAVAISPWQFAGASRQAFELNLGSRLVTVASQRAALQEQHEAIAALIAQARAAEDVRDQHLAAWHRRADRYRQAQASQAS